MSRVIAAVVVGAVATVTARNGVTALVALMQVRWDEQWYDDAVIGVTGAAWRHVDEADGTVR